MSQESGTLYVENLPGDVREGQVEDLLCNGRRIEKSVNEVAALVSGNETESSGNETESCLVLNENKSHVSSVNGSVPETKEIIEHKDEHEKSLELQQFSEYTDNLTPLADSGIFQRPVESDKHVLDIAREHEAEYRASPSMENVAANTHEIVRPETGNADNAAIECVQDALDHTAEHGREHVPSCMTENDAATTKEVILKETEIDNFEDTVFSPVICSKLKPVTENVNDTTIAGGDSASCSGDKVITSVEFELETPGPQSCGSTDSLNVVADSNIVQSLVESDENVLDIAREQETVWKDSPLMNNAAANAHEIIKPETGDADNVVECVEDLPSCLTENGARTAKEGIKQETEVENFEGAVSSPASCSKLTPVEEDVNAPVIAGGDSTRSSIDEVITGVEFELETPGPQSSGSTDSLNVAADSNIVQSPVESDENVLDIAREQETACKASPLMNNVAANAHDIIKPETGDADNVVVACVEDVVDCNTEHGTEDLPSCLTANGAPTVKEGIKQETEVENFEGAVSSPVSCSKLTPIKEDVNDTAIAGGDSTKSSIDKVISSVEFDLENPGPQSSGITDSLNAVADSNIVQSPVERNENVLDIAREQKTACKASSLMDNAAANVHVIIKPENADNFVVECVEDAVDLNTEHGTEDLPSCLTENGAPNVKEGIEQETEVENSEGVVSSHVSCSKLTPIKEDVNDTAIVGGESTGSSIDKVITSVEFELETPGPQSSESTDSLNVAADSNIVQSPVESDENVLDIAREQETICKGSPSMENVSANTHEVIKPEAGDADIHAVECAGDSLDMTTERGTEDVLSCLMSNDALTVKEVIEQETEVENFEGAVSSPVSCSKLTPITEDVNDTAIAGGDSTRSSNDKVITSAEFELETPGPQSSESTDSLNLAAGSSFVQKPVESDENVLDIARKHETEYEAFPSMENAAANTHEIIKTETGDSDNVVVQRVEDAIDLTTECRTEDVLSCLTGNVADTTKGDVEHEPEVENSGVAVFSPVSCSKLKPITEVVSRTTIAIGDSTSIDKVITGTELDLETPCAQDVSTLQGDDDHLQPEISNVDDVSFDAQSVPSGAEKELEVGTSSIENPCNDVSDSFVTKDELPNCVADNVDMQNNGDHLAGAHVNSDDKPICQETKDVEDFLKNEKSMPLPENSCADAVVVQVIEPLTRPFRFLIRIPRFEDSKMKEQIRIAQLLVEEKTLHRDAFRTEVQKYKANCRGYAAEYEAAMSESRTLRRSVRDKRAEIDSLQSVMNKVKNAISVDDIDTRIQGMEHMIEHETLPLKEEKLLIREMKQLKQLREQLSSNIGSPDELQQALNNRDQIEERLKVLKKELEILKDSVLKADAVVRALERKYEDENRRVKEVQTQYAAADAVRQDAYAHLQSLRRELFEKNEQFRKYKDSAAAASDYATKRDRAALHHLCVNQVESILKLWNQNDEFRKEYVRCNMKSTLRRLGTLDGRSLGPDEQPHVLTSYRDERVDRLVSNPVNSVPIVQNQKLELDIVRPVLGIPVGDKIKVKEPEQKIPATRTKNQEEHVLRNDSASASGREITEDDIREERHMPREEVLEIAGKVERHMPTDEELEIARKAEERRKEEAEAMQKEQRRLEERAKAVEALERKKRNAEKAQMRAELRAQKEAEQREKEREKRLRKKERRKGSATEGPEGGNNSVETNPNCESLTETTKDPESKENAAAVSKRPQKISQFTKQSKAKSIPPPLRNRGRRKLQQWMWVILTCLLVVALFLLGNVGFFSNLSNLRRRNSGF